MGLIYRIIRKLFFIVSTHLCHLRTKCIMSWLGVKHSSFKTTGIPHFTICRGGQMTIGDAFTMHNTIQGNPIGCYERCTFFVGNDAHLCIGCHVGISQTALIAITNITIKDNVKIGGGTCIYTSDFHSLDPIIRRGTDDILNRNNAPVVIEEDVFIGARCIILKGVTIGRNSIIGAGSVVTHSIPPNQIWGGNPAVFIRNL